MSNDNKDWIWKTILALGFLGIAYGIGNSDSVTFDKLVNGMSKVAGKIF